MTLLFDQLQLSLAVASHQLEEAVTHLLMLKVNTSEAVEPNSRVRQVNTFRRNFENQASVRTIAEVEWQIKSSSGLKY